MRKSIKKVISLTLSLAMVTSLTACGGGGAETTGNIAETTKATETQTDTQGETKAQEESSDSAEAAEITFSWWGGDSRHQATEKAIAAFEKKYPSIKVTAEYGSWTGWEEKQSLALHAGNATDAMQINWNWIDNYSNNGTNFVDLYEYSDVIDLTQFSQESLDQCSIDGKLMAIPVSMTGALFFWNKATFDMIGCEIPTDKETLLEAGAKFKAYGDDYYPLVFDGGYSRMLLLVYYLESVYGKQWVEDGKLQYTAEEIQEGMDFICELEENHVIPTLAVTSGDMADSTDKNPKWIDGKYAGAFVWDATSKSMGAAIKDSVNVSGQELVQGEFIRLGDYNGGFTKVSMAFAIPASSPHPKEAAMLIDYLLNDPEGVAICAVERGVPLSKKGLSVIEENNLGDPTVVNANKAVLDFSKFGLDSKFDTSDLKANPDGAYEKVFGKLSFGEYDTAEAAQVLWDSVTEVLE